MPVKIIKLMHSVTYRILETSIIVDKWSNG